MQSIGKTGKWKLEVNFKALSAELKLKLILIAQKILLPGQGKRLP